MERADAAYVPLASRAPPWWFIAPLALGIALIAVEQLTDVDRAITRLFVDPQAHTFPLRYSFLLEAVMHHWAKYAVITLGAFTCAAVVFTYIVPPWKPLRRVLVFLALSMALAAAAVEGGKAISTRHCPWDIDEFGGLGPYTHLLEPLPSGVQAGHCFPAGHASTGFVLMAFYFAFYALGRRRAARRALAFSVAAGLVLGFGRVLQGAYFATHVFWAGIVCWVVMLLTYRALLAGRPLPRLRRAGAAPHRPLSPIARVIAFVSQDR
jgi:membrane-associated PAP2 superfamily phosphatase